MPQSQSAGPRKRSFEEYPKALPYFWAGHKLTAKRFLPILKVKQCKGGAAALSGMPGMQTGRMRPLVVLYAAFVSALLGKGLQLAFGIAQPWCFLVLAGAVLFWISDLLILFLYFYHAKHPAVHVANLLTYYYAMFLIAVSLAF